MWLCWFLSAQIIWAALLILATFLSIHYIVEIYNKYEENPFMVSLATRESPIYTLPFPAVTICPVAKSKRTKFNFTQVVHKIWDNETFNEGEKLKAQYMSMLCNLYDDEYLEYFTQNETFEAENFFDTLASIKPKSGVTLFICRFMGDFLDCSDLFVPIILDDGICYSFNILNRQDIFRDLVNHYADYHKGSNESNWSVEEGYPSDASRDTFPKRALLAGADNSLDVFLVQDIKDSDYLCMNDVQGYSVQVHAPFSIPQMRKQYFTLPLDYCAQAMVRPNLLTTSSEVKGYKIKDRQCYFSDERPLKFFKIYSQENCKMECLANFTLKRCGCVGFYLPRDNDTKICGNGNLKCMVNSERIQTEEELDRVLQGDYFSGCNCIPLCTQLTYDVETSRTAWQWRNQFAAERLEERMGMDNFTEISHFSRLVVYFKSDQFIPSQRNELYGFFDFLSNFGGLLGLFTGFSLLSAVEVIYFLSVRLWCNSRIYKDFAGPLPDD